MSQDKPSSYWKQRYDALLTDFDMTVKENSKMWSTLYEVERTVSIGEIMDIINRWEGESSSNKKIKINKPEEGGYKWSQQ